MNKADITVQINTIDDGGVNPASEVRAVYEVLNDSFYGEKTTDTNASTNVLTEFTSTKAYDVKTIKKGGQVTITGTLRNNTGAILSGGTSWFTISNAEYLQITSSVYDFTGESILNRDSIFLTLSGNVLTSSDIIGAGERVIFTLIYSTQA